MFKFCCVVQFCLSLLLNVDKELYNIKSNNIKSDISLVRFSYLTLNPLALWVNLDG